MARPNLHPQAVRALDQMTRASGWLFGGPVDISAIDALRLGDLWAAARRVPMADNRTPAAETARAVQRLGEVREPMFRGPACGDYLDYLADMSEDRQAGGDTYSRRTVWSDVRFALTHCIDLGDGCLATPANRLLALTDWAFSPLLTLTLASLASETAVACVLSTLASEFADAPILLEELRAASRLELSAKMILIDGTDAQRADMAFYADFAEAGLRRAAGRVRAVHNLEVPYASDRAFSPLEVEVIGRRSVFSAGPTGSRASASTPGICGLAPTRSTWRPRASPSAASRSRSTCLQPAISATCPGYRTTKCCWTASSPRPGNWRGGSTRDATDQGDALRIRRLRQVGGEAEAALASADRGSVR
jgi:hypothetical protein